VPLIKNFYFNVQFLTLLSNALCPRIAANVSRLGFGRGGAKSARGELPNYNYTVREQTPRLTPNRSLAAGIFGFVSV